MFITVLFTKRSMLCRAAAEQEIYKVQISSWDFQRAPRCSKKTTTYTAGNFEAFLSVLIPINSWAIGKPSNRQNPNIYPNNFRNQCCISSNKKKGRNYTPKQNRLGTGEMAQRT